MRLKLIACKVLFRELSMLAAQCGNFIDITWMRQGYHRTPELLRETVQQQIDRIDAGDDPCTCCNEIGDFDAVLLGYGLCSNGIVGLHSERYPLVVPRGHDCITFFLGSKERYRTLFDMRSGGTYWYTAGWCENVMMPGRRRTELEYKRYLDKYGEENAEYLMETEQKWYRDYKAAVYVGNSGDGFPDYAGETRDAAEFLGWDFDQEPSDMGLMRDMLDGKWDDERFLVVPPGRRIASSYDERIIMVEP
ncbi:MAG: DUF1638 domain-containing protein [Clostridia bacterium]|nr:DUF1638 domain-containing protein [Clostridia bacterium]